MSITKHRETIITYTEHRYVTLENSLWENSRNAIVYARLFINLNEIIEYIKEKIELLLRANFIIGIKTTSLPLS